jgi:hypothetical protein
MVQRYPHLPFTLKIWSHISLKMIIVYIRHQSPQYLLIGDVFIDGELKLSCGDVSHLRIQMGHELLPIVTLMEDIFQEFPLLKRWFTCHSYFWPTLFHDYI